MALRYLCTVKFLKYEKDYYMVKIQQPRQTYRRRRSHRLWS